jgi:TolB protein
MMVAVMALLACAPTAAPLPTPLLQAAPLPQGPDSLPGGRLVFSVNGDLWQWQDGVLQQLTVGERYEGPAWSPDGDELVASLMGTNHSDLVRLSPDGDLKDRLTDNRGRVRLQDSDWARLGAWSPDSTRIAYGSDVRTFDMALWVIDADGRNRRQVFAPPDYGGGIDRPSWSPDGREIAVAIWRNAPSQIETVNVANGRTRQVTTAAGGAYDPMWSPDGEWIAYAAREGNRHDIYLSRPDSSDHVQLTNSGRARMPVWSPDSRWIAFLRLAEQGFDVRVIPVPAEGEIEAGDGRGLVSGRGIDAPSGMSWGGAGRPARSAAADGS